MAKSKPEPANPATAKSPTLGTKTGGKKSKKKVRPTNTRLPKEDRDRLRRDNRAIYVTVEAESARDSAATIGELTKYVGLVASKDIQCVQASGVSYLVAQYETTAARDAALATLRNADPAFTLNGVPTALKVEAFGAESIQNPIWWISGSMYDGVEGIAWALNA